MKVDQKKLEKSQIELTFELTEEEFKKHIDSALLHLKEHVKMDGFRAGQVPVEMVEKKVGQENLLMEAGELAVKKSYAKFVNENNLEPIGEPEVQMTKIAKGSPLQFKVKVSILPDVELPDYKEISSKVKGNDIFVEEKEIEDALNYLQRSRAKMSQADKGAEVKDFVEIEYENESINQGKVVKDRFVVGEGGFMKDFEDNLVGMKAGDQKEFKAKFPENAPNNLAGKESNFKVKMVSVQKMELPEINDEFAKSLGRDARATHEVGVPALMFDTLVALKSNIKEGITAEKKESEKQRRRGEVLGKIAEKVFESRAPIIGARPSTENFSALVPEKMVEMEEKRLLEDFKTQVVAQFNISFEEYLKSVKKTEEEMVKNFKMDAEKRIKNYLVLRQIGKAEKIEIANSEIEEEINKTIRNYKKEDLDKIDINQLKEYTKSALYNEKIFKLLEDFSK